MFRKFPKRFSKYPKMFSKCPKMFIKCPKMFIKFPKMFIKFPKMFRGNLSSTEANYYQQIMTIFDEKSKFHILRIREIAPVPIRTIPNPMFMMGPLT